MTDNATDSHQPATPVGVSSSEGLGAGAEAHRRQRGAVPDFVLFWGVGLAIGCGLLWIFYSAHKGVPKLRAECEARGGMLISTRSELYACVGKPPELPASR